MGTTRKGGKRGYKAEARRRWGAKNIIAIEGQGPWALVSLCPNWIKISLWPTEAEAIRTQAIVNIGCGHACWGPRYHIIEDLRRKAHAPSASPTPSPAGGRN